ncbi:type I-D CRISPR-associated helicase Cas3' [Kroppenstedtia eburnea]|uniref:type I-D CRISPR-associated helicase Cas3' n=1 Tax=Kroppenstedtia eburnea TaxID=714067 RepID=UPI0036439BDB
MILQVKEAIAQTYKVPFIDGIHPYAHQVVQLHLIQETIKEEKQRIIWNQAMTGAGKTLANYSPLTKLPRSRALGVYPVNELIKDQFHSVQAGVPMKQWEEVTVWTAEKMRMDRRPGETKIDQIYRMTTPYYRAILTNPDHLMLIAQERLYSFKKGDAVQPFYRLAEYNLQIFDEFHLYDIAQVNFLAQWMALLKSLFPHKAYAFLLSSATPRSEFFRLAEGMNMEIRNVQEEIENWLQSEQPAVAGERVYLEPLTLRLQPTNLQRWDTGEQILKEWDEVESYLREWPKAKGLIILDSIHEAQVLASALREKGYDVGEVHGLSDRMHSREALAKPITVATATVEVGVDFQGEIRKDFLLFEARNAGSFMQRIGRIGRGSRVHPDPPLQVWAYVPAYVEEQIKELACDEISRKELQSSVTAAYQRYQDFFPYIEKVGGINLIHGYHLARRHHMDRDQNRVLQRLQEIVEDMYHLGFKEQEHQYLDWKRKKMVEPVLSFRGQNSLEHQLWRQSGWEEEGDTFYPEIWFWDETTPDLPLKKYDYQFVLRRRKVQFITKEEMANRVRNHFSEQEQDKWLETLKTDRVLGYAVASGVREKPAKLYWRLPPSAAYQTEKVVRLGRLQLQSDDPLLDEQLKDLFLGSSPKTWIVYMIKRSVGEVTDLLRLPPMFRLHSAKTRQGADWSIAFNVDAFKLWSVWSNGESVVQ